MTHKLPADLNTRYINEFLEALTSDNIYANLPEMRLEALDFSAKEIQESFYNGTVEI